MRSIRRGGCATTESTLSRRSRSRQAVLDGAADIDAMPTRYDAITAFLTTASLANSAPATGSGPACTQLRHGSTTATRPRTRQPEEPFGDQGQFRSNYLDVTAGIERWIDAANEFRSLQDQLANNDLPRFEKDFKDQLNTDTINDLAGFFASSCAAKPNQDSCADRDHQLLAARHRLRRRFMSWSARRTTHQDIKDFQSELRACTDDSVLDQSEQLLRGALPAGKGHHRAVPGPRDPGDADRRWTRWVTDVRNWFTLARVRALQGDR